MRELQLAGIPSLAATRPRRAGRARLPSSRTAFIASIAVHVLAGYWLSRHVLGGPPLPPAPSAEFFLFERPAPRASAAAPAEAAAEAVPEVPQQREPAPEPRPVQREVEPTIVVEPLPPSVEPAPQSDVAPAPAPRAYIDFDEERRRAANQVIGSRAAENEYLTFSLDDAAAPRAEPEPKPERSIFDLGGASGGRSVAALGQQRTKVGRKLAELCNALTGGFSVFGLFSGCTSSDFEPTGLFPEVRPAYLDLMPECVDTRDIAPALALEAPFPTVKCRLVEREEIPDELP